MNIFKIIKKSLTEACVFFCVIFAIFAPISLTVDKAEGLYPLEQTFLFFIFALLFSLANAVYRMKALGGGLRLFLHYLITLLSFYLCFMLYMGMVGMQVLVGIFLYTVIYFIVAGIIALFKSRFNRLKNEHSAYEKKFKNTKRK